MNDGRSFGAITFPRIFRFQDWFIACLTVTSEKVKALPKDNQAKFLKGIAGVLSKKNAAHDVGSYKDAPPGFRFWCGPTIEAADIKAAVAELEKIYRQKIAEL